MGQFSLPAGDAGHVRHAETTRRRTWIPLDIALTVVMLGLTSVFVGTLALSLS